MRYAVWFRHRTVVNTDPQRRCYDGHHFSSKTVWTEWARVYSLSTREDAESAIKTFQAINPTHQYEIREEITL